MIHDPTRCSIDDGNDGATVLLHSHDNVRMSISVDIANSYIEAAAEVPSGVYVAINWRVVPL